MSVEDIKLGNVDPSVCFKYTGPILDIEKYFKYPIDSLIEGDGYWDINSSKTITAEDIALFKDLIYSPYDEVYYMQEGDNDAQSWFILAKTKGYYIYFEASCDYTGFNCRGGGTFAYSKDWKTLWNMYTTNEFRTLMLMIYNYETLNFINSYAYYSDIEYLKHKREGGESSEED